MDKKIAGTKIKNGLKILFWLGLFVFFVYSFQKIINLESLTNPVRQKGFVHVLTALSKPNLFDPEITSVVAAYMWGTVQMAFLATTISMIFAIPITYLSARPFSISGHGFNLLLQPILAGIRSVHPVIITIPTVVIVGIGPTAGVLALTLYSTAVLIGIFSDYAKQHMTLNWTILFKVHFPALAFKQFPVNILISTLLGIVGGGGIGFLLHQYFNLLNYNDVSVVLLAYIIVIGSIDILSRYVWRKIQNHREYLPSSPKNEIAH
ncbi:MAG: hypothetical protein CL609_08955 [Anaerolineaceae bacterium]|nr:hypothetical protein [Anaerolineaceae bacterium]